MSKSPLGAVIVPVTPFQQNCSVVWCRQTMRGAVVDPGGDLDIVLDAARKHGVTIERIMITHGHVDHAGGTQDLRERLGVPVDGPHREEAWLIDQMEEAGARWHLSPARRFTPDRWLEEGETVSVGELSFEVRHCPGHTPGHIVFFSAAARVAFVGDVLFQGSIGRTDFPRGDHEALIKSITTKLWPLGDDVTFVPGHGPTSTFGQERRMNPFVSDWVLAN